MLVETKAKVGVFAIALGAYLPQFPTLVPEFEAQYDAFKKTIPDTVELVDGGIVTTKELSMKAVHLSEQIETETGKAPSVSVLAEKLGVPEEKCAEALNAAAQPVSLTGDDENNETDIPVDAPEEKITDHLALQQILKALPEEDQRLIYYRYFKNQTQTETAKRLGTTQVQISRREKKLLLRLRGLLL